MSTENKDSEKDWIYRDSTKKLLMRGLLVACAVSVLLELFVLGRTRKFDFDWGFGFFASVGFVSCTMMILGAKLLGFVLKVPTDFYEHDGEEGSE